MPRDLPLTLITAAILLAVPTASPAESNRDVALGLGGEIYHARVGLCGELLDDCAEGEEDHPVLALEITRPGEPEERLLVPGTGGVEAEGAPAVVFEDASSSLFLVWESRLQPQRSEVDLIWFDGQAFSEVIEVTGQTGPLKGPPQLVITRGTYHLDGDEAGETLARQRTVLHVAWWEQGPVHEEVYYTPIVLEDGAYLGINEVYNLSERDPDPPPPEPVTLSSELLRWPKLEPGGDEHSVVIGFANPVSGRFVTFEVEVLPGEVSHLGERIRSHMIEFGEEYRIDTLPEFAERIRSHMIEFGHRLHPAVLAYLAVDIEMQILASDPAAEAVAELADRIRSHMIEFGARTLAAGGLTAMPTGTGSEVLETRPDEAAVSPIPHQLWLRQVSSRPAPTIGEHPVWIFLSEDGGDAVISWENAGNLYYRETTATGWTVVRRIDLSGTIDASRAEQILRQRVRER